MTENLPAVHETAYEGELMLGEDRAYPQIRNEHTDGWVAVIKPISDLAVQVAETEFVPKALRNKPEAVAASILFGRELAMPPMQSLQQVHMIEGRPSVSAEHLRAMVLAAGHEIRFGEVSSSTCKIAGKRRGSDVWTWIEWTLAMAAEAKLTGKDNWRKYPRAMLVARASADLCRMIFADVTHGVRATEELDDGEDTGGGTPVAAELGKTTVGRAKKTAAPKSAVTSNQGPEQEAKRPGTSTAPLPPPVAPVASSEARPGTAAAPASRPDQGEAVTSPAEPLPPKHCELTGKHYPHTWQGFTDEDGPWHCDGEEAPEQARCPHISNGQYCRYYAGHDGKHIFGGGLGDPVSLRHCESRAEHDPHAWDDKGNTYSCSGSALVGGEDAASAPVESEPRPMHTAQTKALQARFKGLGFTDEPDDREKRLLIASAIVGRDVETFQATGETAMNYDEAQSIMTALRTCHTREDVIAVMAEIAKSTED